LRTGYKQATWIWVVSHSRNIKLKRIQANPINFRRQLWAYLYLFNYRLFLVLQT
jgi:hypothetical protein